MTGTSSSGERWPLWSTSSESNFSIDESTNSSLMRYSRHSSGSVGRILSAHAASSRTFSMTSSMRSTSASSGSAAGALSLAAPAPTCDMTTRNCRNRKNSTRSITPLPSLSKTAANCTQCAASMSHGELCESLAMTGASSSGVSVPLPSTSSASYSPRQLSMNSSELR